LVSESLFWLGKSWQITFRNGGFSVANFAYHDMTRLRTLKTPRWPALAHPLPEPWRQSCGSSRLSPSRSSELFGVVWKCPKVGGKPPSLNVRQLSLGGTPLLHHPSHRWAFFSTETHVKNPPFGFVGKLEENLHMWCLEGDLG
jgi:hypothetical protein